MLTVSNKMFHQHNSWHRRGQRAFLFLLLYPLTKESTNRLSGTIGITASVVAEAQEPRNSSGILVGDKDFCAAFPAALTWAAF